MQVKAANDENLFSQLGDAQNAGRDAGEADARAGYDKNPNCQGGMGYCAAYNWGYDEGYNAVKLVG
jgi:hypothetical protein